MNKILALLVMLSLQLVVLTNYAAVLNYLPNIDASASPTQSLATEDPAHCTAETSAEKAVTLQVSDLDRQDTLDLCLPSVLVTSSLSLAYRPIGSALSCYGFTSITFYDPGFLRPPRNARSSALPS